MNLLEEIGNARHIAIAGHIRPDGDCISSCLALKAYLENAIEDAEITVYMEPNPPSIFSELKGYKSMNTEYEENLGPFEVFITVDASSTDRLGKAFPIFEEAGKKICIDHHESNPGFADVNEIKPYACSTCEVLFDLFEKQYIDSEVAEALFVGIVHDSGVFQYSNMSRHSFNIVGELVEYDFDGPRIIRETFYTKTFAQNKILGRALEDSRLYLDGKVITSYISSQLRKEYNVLPKHFEGIVNQLQNTRGVEVALFMYETDDGSVKVSMRSNGAVNVADVALEFGGGGHNKAAGADVKGNHEEVLNAFLKVIKEKLEE